MGDRSQAAILGRVITSEIVVKHAEDGPNLLDVLARLPNDLSLTRLAVVVESPRARSACKATSPCSTDTPQDAPHLTVKMRRSTTFNQNRGRNELAAS